MKKELVNRAISRWQALKSAQHRGEPWQREGRGARPSMLLTSCPRAALNLLVWSTKLWFESEAVADQIAATVAQGGSHGGRTGFGGSGSGSGSAGSGAASGSTSDTSAVALVAEMYESARASRKEPTDPCVWVGVGIITAVCAGDSGAPTNGSSETIRSSNGSSIIEMMHCVLAPCTGRNLLARGYASAAKRVCLRH